MRPIPADQSPSQGNDNTLGTGDGEPTYGRYGESYGGGDNNFGILRQIDGHDTYPQPNGDGGYDQRNIHHPFQDDINDGMTD